MADINRSMSPAFTIMDPSPFGSDSEDLVSVSEILEFCNVAHLQEFALKNPTSDEELLRYETALQRFNSTLRVRHQETYEHEAFGWSEDERTSYQNLLDDATKAGVPKNCLVHWVESSTSWWADKTPLPGAPLSLSAERPLSPPPTPRKPSFARTSLTGPRSKILKGMAVLVSGSRPASAVPEAEVSVPSLASTNSQASQTPLMKMHIRRDSLMNFWRRPSTKRASTTSELDTQYDLVLDGTRSIVSFNAPVETTVITPPTSSRSSLSMPPGLQLFSTSDRVHILEAMQSKRFIDLQRNCDQMANQFIEYAATANAALSLLCGRFLCIMDRHVKKCTQEEMKRLEEKYEAEMDTLDTRHVAKELELKELQKAEEQEMAERNATALKHVTRRLSILGDAATYEDRKRLFEEQETMNELKRKHARDLASLRRTNGRQRLDLERKQQTELDHVHPRFQAKFVSRAAPRYPRLKQDMSDLAITLHQRRSRLLARWYVELQKFKAETSTLRSIEAALPLSLLTLPDEFMAY